MSRRRRRRRRPDGAVELNLAAMLDMAFQLLTFFILTFRPVPAEGQILLRLPPAEAISPTKVAAPAGETPTDSNPVQGLSTLVINVIPNSAGGISTLAVGEAAVGNLGALERRLAEVLSNPANTFDQVVIHVGSGLRYDALMGVVDACTQQKLPNGQKLSKLSFIELPDEGTP